MPPRSDVLTLWAMVLIRSWPCVLAVLSAQARCGGEADPSNMATSAPPEYFDFTKVIDRTKAPKAYSLDDQASLAARGAT
jgi:hypothetical protein